MSKRVSPTDRLRAEVDELFASGRDLAAILEDVACVSVRLMMQTALEAEVDAFLGRARYQRRDEAGPAGNRNGWQPPTTVRTTMGDVERQRPSRAAPTRRSAPGYSGQGSPGPTRWRRW